VVAGKFRIERLLAEGGMGLIVAATHLQLEQTVALKFFRNDLGTEGEPLLRFMREARAAAQLKSEFVARVLDVGVTEGGVPYMVMEYLEGQGLESIVASAGPMDIPSATEYAIQACEGLAEAHARGIVHRDIKPSNLFLIERSPGWRTIKILDFGISKVSVARASNITTNLNVVMGTPCYMSPEQFQSAAGVDHRTDIWSLGSTLYEMLAGRAPFNPALPLLAIAEEIVSKHPPALRQLRPEVPQELSDVIARCLAKDREQRIPSAAALAMALLPFARGRARATAERAAAITPAFGLEKVEPALMTREASDESRSGVLLTQIGFASPTPPAQESPLAAARAATSPPPEAPPEASSEALPDAAPEFPSEAPSAARSGDAPPALTTAIYRADRRGGRGSRGWPPRGPTLVVSTLVVVGGAILYLAVRPLPRPDQPAFATIPAILAPALGAPRPPAEIPSSNELVVRVSPPSAQIMIDGASVSGNPFHGRFQSGGIHQIQAFAAGYEPKVRQASLSSDVVVDVTLERRRDPPPSRTPLPPPVSRAPPRRVRSREPMRAFPPWQAAPPRSSEAPPFRAAALASPEIVDPRGGRAPLHPIETRSPYETP
jgi:serine/threonine-protein kinase